MYERSAIVLERFFANLLGWNKVNNIKQNFNNYCELFEKFKVSQKANSEEFAALKEFQDAENEIEDIQSHEEKLYKKNAKLEYNRDLVFQDISQSPEEIERCGQKLEADIAKGQEKLVSLREEFVEAVKDYNEKKSALAKCKKTRKLAENEYNAIFEETKKNYENIPAEYIEAAREFSENEIEQDVIKALSENGKDEKIPFNNQVITNAAKIGFNTAIREVACYLQAYQLAQKLVNELLEGAVSMELHEKAIRNITAELSFLAAEKEYIVGFLDYERITVIYGKRMHRSLMMDACEKLEEDMEQVENLHKLLSKEIAEKPTKKAYRELYNKSYLIEMEDKDAKFKKEKTRVNLSAGTVMNSNYWRIEGIKNIYTVFYRNIVEVFGKDLDEFEIPEEQDENLEEEATVLDTNLDNVIDEIEEIKEEPVVKKKSVQKAEKVEKAESVKAKAVKAEVKEAKKEKVEPVEVIEVAEIEEPKATTKKAKKKKKVYTSNEKLSQKKKLQNVLAFAEELDDYEEEEPDIVEAEPIEPEENIDTEIDEILSTKRTLKLAKIVKRRGRKKLKHYTRQIIQFSEPLIEEVNPVVEKAEEDNDFDIFGEKYRDIDSRIAELDDLEDLEDIESSSDDIELEDDLDLNESVAFSEEADEESIFDVIEEDNQDLGLEEFEIDAKASKKKTKNTLFNSLKKLNTKSKKSTAKE